MWTTSRDYFLLEASSNFNILIFLNSKDDLTSTMKKKVKVKGISYCGISLFVCLTFPETKRSDNFIISKKKDVRYAQFKY